MLFLCFFGLLFFQSAISQQRCLRFCRVDLTYEKYKNNILDLNPQACTHLILNAYSSDSRLNLKLLEKTFEDFKNTIFASKTKIMVNILNGNISATTTNDIIDNQVFLNKFDGLYIHWLDNVLHGWKFENQPLNVKKEINFIVNLRRIFNDKIIVATIGFESLLNEEYFDFEIFKNNIDFISLDSGNALLQRIHMQNDLGVRHISSEISLKSPTKKLNLDSLARTWINNGFPKDKLLIYADGEKYDIEPRFKVIWSSLNKFPGVLIDNLQRIKYPIFSISEIVNNVKKYEKLQICSSSDKPVEQKDKLGISCYFDLFRLEETEVKENLLKIKKELWKKCDRIIFQKAVMTSSLNILVLSSHFFKIQEQLHSLNLSNIPLIFSMKMKDVFDGESAKSENNVNQIVSNIYEFIQKYNLCGIEFICYESFNIEKLEKIISSLNSRGEYQIGLQVNAFKAEQFIPLMNYVTWITHKINPISDAALAIYHQWNKLHENYGLNLKKVIIKIFPGIWKQNSDLTFLPGFVNWGILENENPEFDELLNRKYLCLNETIRNHTIASESNQFSNMPMVFTVFENFQEKKKRLLKLLETANDTEAIKILSLNIMFRGNFPTDLFRFRYETTETIKYKIKIAEKHRFGGIALASITDDDVNDICGTSIWKNL